MRVKKMATDEVRLFSRGKMAEKGVFQLTDLPDKAQNI